MPTIAVFLMPLLLGIFNVQVHWAAPNRDKITIVAGRQDGFITQCIQSGLQVRYNFQIELCRRRSLWLPYCAPEHIETRAVQYDPISQQYNVVLDTYHDKQAPHTIVVETAHAALLMADVVKDLSLAQLMANGAERLDLQRSYVSVRVTSKCKGRRRGILARIPTIMSLGLINSSVSDSGWVSFDLSNGKITAP